MRTVIFDLDGTLADTSGDLIAAANVALEAAGIDQRLTHGVDDGTALRGGRAMLELGVRRAGVPEVEREGIISAGYPVLLAAYGDAIDHHTSFYPGALEAVERLTTEGHRVGICTNKPEGLAEKLLTRLGVRDAFHSLIGADTLPTRKPDAAPVFAAIDRAGGDRSLACLVGDTVTDREAARAAGIASILVTFAPAGRQVAELQPEALLNAYADLPDVLDRLFA